MGWHPSTPSIAQRGGAYSISYVVAHHTPFLGRYGASATASGRPSSILILYLSLSQQVGTLMLSIKVCTAGKVGFVAPVKKSPSSDRPRSFVYARTLHGRIPDTPAWHKRPMHQQEDR